MTILELYSKGTRNADRPVSKYASTIITQTNPQSNPLLKKAAATSTYGPGMFNSDTLTYTDRRFAIANASLGQAAVTPSVLQAAQQGGLITTAIDSSNPVGTGQTAVFDDGRYIPKVGFGYVLYVTRGAYA
jgi:hypothetical protein